MDQLFCMRVFARVIEQGSFARAADDLGLSRPTVTNAVAQLEKRLGTRLLHRTTRRLSPTDEGRTYHQRCLRILDDVAEADDAVSSTRIKARGRLRASVPESFTLMMPKLPKFLQSNPGLDLELVITDRAVNLVEEGIDCAARGADFPSDSTLVARRISHSRWITCASPAYLAAHRTPSCIEDLQRHNCIRYVSPSTGRVTDWRFLADGGQHSFTPRGNLGVTSMAGAVSAALAGVGIAQVPDPVVFNHIFSGELQPVLIEYLAPTTPFAVVYPSNRYLSAKVKAFANFVAEIYPADGFWPEIMRRAKVTAATRTRAAAGPVKTVARRKPDSR